METFEEVFPMPVGVFPDDDSMATGWLRFPHARGGVSTGTSEKPA